MNRQTYYKILHVQPDAPEEIIRATYRTLLRELKNHPDLGGDTMNAALINQAYETLIDRDKRSEYDKKLLNRPVRRGLNGRKSSKDPALIGNTRNKVYTENRTNRSERRAVHRVKKNGTIHYDASPPQTGRDAEMLDLSPQGICFTSSSRLTPDLTVRIRSPFFNALARIIRSDETIQHNGRSCYSIGARFLKIRFRNQKGSFYSRLVDEVN